MKARIIIICVIFVLTIAAIIAMKAQHDRIVRLSSQLADADARIEMLTDAIDRVRAIAEKGNNVQTVYIERIKADAAEHADKIIEVETDESACDWLDQLLPDSVRKRYGCNTATGDRDTTDSID